MVKEAKRNEGAEKYENYVTYENTPLFNHLMDNNSYPMLLYYTKKTNKYLNKYYANKSHNLNINF